MVPTVPEKSITVGSLLGSGGFSSVYDVTITKLDRDETGKPSELFHSWTSTEPPLLISIDSDDSSSDHSSVASNSSSSTIASLKRETDAKSLAIKKLKPEILNSDEDSHAATQDLINEATILSKLPLHKNIIRLEAVSVNFWDQPTGASIDSPPRFVLLEKLESTLAQRLKQWSQSLQRPPRKRNALISIEADRLEQAGVLGLAKAMEFLHANDVIFRDLKPQNVGFAQTDGTVRLFDFGLARFMPKDENYYMSFVGTLQYVAPEILTEEGKYDQSVDVYSFGMVLWEICTLERPFGKPKSAEQLEKWVSKGKNRPCMRKVASPALRNLIAKCIHSDPTKRPSFAQLVQCL